MATPLTIYTFIPVGAHASYYYRVKLAMETARDLGLPIKSIIDTNIEGVNQQERVQNFCHADVTLMYQPVWEGSLHNLKIAKSFLPSKVESGWKYPPTAIVDTDDNLFRVDPHNPAFQTLGYRDPETGDEVPKGQAISKLEDGKRVVMWKDGAKDEKGNVVFDAQRNKAVIETYRQIINEADCVTCTTPRLAEAIKAETQPRRVRVTPNLVRFDHYKQLSLAPHDGVRILWQGGQNHYMDWYPLKDSLGRITKKYPQVHWVMWGVNYHWITELIPPDRMTFEPWAPYEEYKLRRIMMDDDISLAPLGDNPFNRCRSAIKFYEASVQKRPAATLAQNTGPYGDEIVDGETGLLFDTPEEFEERLSLLIEDAEQRKLLAKNAKDWVSENRDAMKEVPKQIQFYENLRHETEYDHPHMHETQWVKFVAEMEAQQNAQAEQQAKEAQAA